MSLFLSGTYPEILGYVPLGESNFANLILGRLAIPDAFGIVLFRLTFRAKGFFFLPQTLHSVNVLVHQWRFGAELIPKARCDS